MEEKGNKRKEKNENLSSLDSHFEVLKALKKRLEDSLLSSSAKEALRRILETEQK